MFHLMAILRKKSLNPAIHNLHRIRKIHRISWISRIGMINRISRISMMTKKVHSKTKNLSIISKFLS